MGGIITLRDIKVNTECAGEASRGVKNGRMETFGQRLRRLRRLAKMSQEELAHASGYAGQSRIANYEGDKRMPSVSEIDILATALGVSKSALVEPSSTGDQSSQAPTEVASRETPAAYVRFPLLEGFAGMGRGDYMGDYPEIVEFVEVTREWAGQKLRGVPLAEVRVITGRGDSMRGQYNDGDLIFMDSRVKRFVGDSAYCFRLHGQVQIKRLQMVGRNLVRVLSANAAYPPLDVALEDVEIGGRALAAWTLTEF